MLKKKDEQIQLMGKDCDDNLGTMHKVLKNKILDLTKA